MKEWDVDQPTDYSPAAAAAAAGGNLSTPIDISPGDIRKGNLGLLCQQGSDVRKQYLKNLNLLSVLTEIHPYRHKRRFYSNSFLC